LTHNELLIQIEYVAGRLNIQIQYEPLKIEDPTAFIGYGKTGRENNYNFLEIPNFPV